MTTLTQLRETLEKADAIAVEWSDLDTALETADERELHDTLQAALALLDRLEAERQLSECADAVEVAVVKAGIDAKVSSQTDFLLRR